MECVKGHDRETLQIFFPLPLHSHNHQHLGDPGSTLVCVLSLHYILVSCVYINTVEGGRGR